MSLEYDVTILVTCYKQEQYLQRAMQSAVDQVVPFGRNQSMPKFIVKHFIDNIGMGASAARNTAIRSLVSTPWIILLDADDMLPSHYLYYIWSLWQLFRVPKSFYGSPVQFIEGLRMDRLFYGQYSNNTFEESCPIAGITAMFPTAGFHEIGGFDENLRTLNDWDFWLRLRRAGFHYCHSQNTFVLRRGNVPGSITQQGMSSEEKSKAVLRAFNDKHGTKINRYPQLYTIPARS